MGHFFSMAGGNERNSRRKTDATRFVAAVDTDKTRRDGLDPWLRKVIAGRGQTSGLEQLGHLKPETRLGYEAMATLPLT